jgi:hypothetical protein
MYIIKINTCPNYRFDFYALTNIKQEDLKACISEFKHQKKEEDEDYTNKEIERYVNNHFSLCKLNYFEIRDIKYLSI